MNNLGASYRLCRISQGPVRATITATVCCRCLYELQTKFTIRSTTKCTRTSASRRQYSQDSARSSSQQNGRIQWYHIPVGLGIAFLGVVQMRKVFTRERRKQLEEQLEDGPPKRERVKPEGPWYVASSYLLVQDAMNCVNAINLTTREGRQAQIMSALPLKAISRIWGWFNELTIPYYLRVPGFKLYSIIFGVK